MGIQKVKKSKSKTMIRRRGNDKRAFHAVSKCPECGKLKVPHRVCSFCGSYKGRTIVKMD